MKKEQAEKFFSEFYYGVHHIPGKLYPFGDGWMVKHDRSELASYDFNGLTRLVLMAHEYCYRVSIMPLNFNTIKIAVFERKQGGGLTTGHPTIEQSIALFNQSKIIVE